MVQCRHCLWLSANPDFSVLRNVLLQPAVPALRQKYAGVGFLAEQKIQNIARLFAPDRHGPDAAETGVDHLRAFLQLRVVPAAEQVFRHRIVLPQKSDRLFRQPGLIKLQRAAEGINLFILFAPVLGFLFRRYPFRPLSFRRRGRFCGRSRWGLTV